MVNSPADFQAIVPFAGFVNCITRHITRFVGIPITAPGNFTSFILVLMLGAPPVNLVPSTAYVPSAMRTKSLPVFRILVWYVPSFLNSHVKPKKSALYQEPTILSGGADLQE